MHAGLFPRRMTSELPVCGTILQHTETHCKTLQHTGNTLQHTADFKKASLLRVPLNLLHCNTLQHTSTHYNTLQHTGITLQHTGNTHSNTLTTPWQHTGNTLATPWQHSTHLENDFFTPISADFASNRGVVVNDRVDIVMVHFDPRPLYHVYVLIFYYFFLLECTGLLPLGAPVFCRCVPCNAECAERARGAAEHLRRTAAHCSALQHTSDRI